MEGITRRHRIAGLAVLVLSTLAAFGALVPSAGADTAFPVWTCRASAAYVELAPLLGTQRAEPVLANGFPDRVTPDEAQCATSNTGVQDIDIPEDTGPTSPSPLITLNAASASTAITPPIAAARDQVATAQTGIVGQLKVAIGALVIDAQAVTAQAQGQCVNGVPALTGSSQIAKLTINGTTVLDLPGTNLPTTITDINLSPLLRIRLNQSLSATTPGDVNTPAGAELTQRAVEIELLPDLVAGSQPLTRIVLGEAKADYHGAVCAPAPPPPTCPTGSTQTGTNPLVCSVTVIQCAPGSTPNPSTPGSCVLTCPAGSTAGSNGACVITQTVGPPPCPAGTTADPNAAGACIRPATPAACPAGTTRDPASQACILLVQRPCPAGATADPATKVCVVSTVKTVGSGAPNGRVGSPTGPAPTCGRLEMHFVRGGRRSLVNTIGTRVVTRGRLVSCGSRPRPIVGARIDVIHVLPDGRRLRKTGLRSRGDGKLTLILPNDLRTRKIEYGYRPNLNTTRVSSKVTLRLTVRNRLGRVIR
jgi:hypothetical protein